MPTLNREQLKLWLEEKGYSLFPNLTSGEREKLANILLDPSIIGEIIEDKEPARIQELLKEGLKLPPSEFEKKVTPGQINTFLESLEKIV